MLEQKYDCPFCDGKSTIERMPAGHYVCMKCRHATETVPTEADGQRYREQSHADISPLHNDDGILSYLLLRTLPLIFRGITHCLAWAIWMTFIGIFTWVFDAKSQPFWPAIKFWPLWGLLIGLAHFSVKLSREQSFEDTANVIAEGVRRSR